MLTFKTDFIRITYFGSFRPGGGSGSRSAICFPPDPGGPRMGAPLPFKYPADVRINADIWIRRSSAINKCIWNTNTVLKANDAKILVT